ncbi:MAG TPA: YaeQ family protein [Vicinamibacterales bacterium]|nr:YaeQ family protein [Vicinamibacterales bacterium]
MALTATIYSFETQIADVDRAVYETVSLRMARQPSETADYMLTRLLAYCLEYTEGIAFTEGVAAGDDPAVLVRDLTGRLRTWIEVGLPDADRIHRASKRADRMAIYTHRDVSRVLAELNGKKIHRAAEIPVFEFGRGFVEDVASRLDRRAGIAVSVTERQLYLDINGESFQTVITEHHFA